MSISPRKYHGDELKCGGPQVCSDCEDRLESAMMTSILDFGKPDCFYCGTCGEKFPDADTFTAHVAINPWGECGDA